MPNLTMKQAELIINDLRKDYEGLFENHIGHPNHYEEFNDVFSKVEGDLKPQTDKPLSEDNEAALVTAGNIIGVLKELADKGVEFNTKQTWEEETLHIAQQALDKRIVIMPEIPSKPEGYDEPRGKVSTDYGWHDLPSYSKDTAEIDHYEDAHGPINLEIVLGLINDEDSYFFKLMEKYTSNDEVSENPDTSKVQQLINKFERTSNGKKSTNPKQEEPENKGNVKQLINQFNSHTTEQAPNKAREDIPQSIFSVKDRIRDIESRKPTRPH